MTFEESMVNAYNKILLGRNINELVDEWNISNLNCSSMVEFFSEDAIYGFIVGQRDNIIIFTNYHREAKKGTGTPTLKKLESSFRMLADTRNQQVVSIFDLYGQKDTEAWLIKNNYIQISDSRYIKKFESSIVNNNI